MKGELPEGWRFVAGCGDGLVEREQSPRRDDVQICDDIDGLDVEIDNRANYYGYNTGAIIPWPVVAHFMRRAGWTVTPPGGREP